MSSRLFLSVRERRGLAYFVRSSLNPYQDTGNMCIQSGLARTRVREALKVIMKELARIKAKDVTSEELTRAKEYVKGKTYLDLEDSSRLADWFARQELLTKKIETPEERLEKIFAVTKEDVRRVANDVFRRNRMTLAVIGPFDAREKFLQHAEIL
jgi:predicted Zn-dependent peptidase